MPIRLARFEMPNRLVKDEATATDTYAQFIAEPFERGYGHTIGNSLRRVLLSSLEGASITSRPHQRRAARILQPSRACVEDVTDIVLNLKKVKFIARRTRRPASSRSTSTRKASSPPATSRTTTATTWSTRTRSSAPSTEGEVRRRNRSPRRPRLLHRRRKQAPGHADRRHPDRLHLLARSPA